MKAFNSYLTVLIIVFIVLVSDRSAKAQDNCCGDIVYDPATEECCDGWVVALGQCCNGSPLEEGQVCCESTAVLEAECCDEKILQDGEACCIGISSEETYEVSSKCCVDKTVSNVVMDKFGSDYLECPDRVQVTGYHGYGDQYCSVPVLNPPYRDNPSLLPEDTTPCSGSTTSFLSACQAHDECYGNCQPQPNADIAFDSCNSAFYSSMADKCYASSNVECEDHCLEWASIYSSAVGQYGREHFDAGQNESCQCCPDA